MKSIAAGPLSRSSATALSKQLSARFLSVCRNLHWKSLEKKGTCTKKTRRYSQGQRQGKPQKQGLEGQDLEDLGVRYFRNPLRGPLTHVVPKPPRKKKTQNPENPDYPQK